MQMEEIIKSIEKIYGSSTNQVAVIDSDAKVVWCNDIPISMIEKITPGMDLSAVAKSVFWSQSKSVLRRGKVVQMVVSINDMKFYLFMEPFVVNEEHIYSLVHFTHLQALYDLSVAKIVHDIKNPLNMLKSLSQKLDGDDKKNFIFYHGVLEGLIGDLQISNAYIQEEKEAEYVNITEFVGEIFTECRKTLESRFQVDVRMTDKTITCKVNAKEIENAIINLIVNAKNHAASYIKFELYEHNGNAVIAVENDGDKVDEAIKDNIYELCVKSDSSRGSGIGLYTVKTVAQKYDGDICLAAGKNTRFELSIPLTVAAQVKNSDECPQINPHYVRYVLEENNG